MLKLLEGIRSVAVIVARYTGLSLGELQGLQWADITDLIESSADYLARHRREPKTKARKDSIPLLTIVSHALKEHRK